MNGVDGVAKFVSCDQRFELVVAWIGPPPLHGPEGAAVRPGAARVTGNAAASQDRLIRSLTRLDLGLGWFLLWRFKVGKGE